MDPLTHTLLGATAATALFHRQLGVRRAATIGALAGFFPDLDVVLQKPGDPVFSLVYHRHFTHSLFFVPVIALLATLPFLLRRAWRPEWKLMLGAAAVAAFTHGILDSMTSYGTLLFWPFSNGRVSWDILPIVDLFFTPVLLLGLATALVLKRGLPARVAFGVAILYAGIGIIQNARARDAAHELARARGHEPVAVRAMAAPGALVLWRTIYEHEGEWHFAGVRTPYLRRSLVNPGSSAIVATRDQLPTELAAVPDADRVFRTFSWFAEETVTWGDEERTILIDARYSSDLEGMAPLWGIEFTPEGQTNWQPGRMEGRAGRLWRLLRDGDDAYRALELALPEIAGDYPGNSGE